MPREGRSHIPDYHFAIASGEFSHQSQSKRKIKRKTQGANPTQKKMILVRGGGEKKVRQVMRSVRQVGVAWTAKSINLNLNNRITRRIDRALGA